MTAGKLYYTRFYYEHVLKNMRPFEDVPYDVIAAADDGDDKMFWKILATQDNILELTGTCGCGRPDLFLDSLHKYLGTLEFNPDKFPELVDAFGNGKVVDSPFTDNENFEATMMYFCDKMGLTEHGTSIYAAWLTEKGALLKVLLMKYHMLADDNENKDK